MSVYIKGMEMPTDGMNNIMILADGRVFQFSGYGNPKPLGTAIPVPDHGDLIDKQYAYQNTMAMGEQTRKIVLKQIDALPVVIPEDIKTMYYPQVDGITPTVISVDKEEAEE